VNKKVSELMGIKRLSFATAEQTTEVTGMMIGGVVAIGIEGMPIYIDAAVFDNEEIVMGGGNRSTKLLLSPKELNKLPTVEIIENLAKPKE
jgi:prolyl-tRNA editing enzyme YbaK/EbsC (Cys-tRNA(Pro) deacylase)